MNEKHEMTTPRDGYDRWSSIYDGDDNPLIALEEPILAKRIGPINGLRIADIGCGTGRYALRFAASGAEVTGVDFSTGMLEVMRAKRPEGALSIIEHDLTQGIPLDDDTFDIAICCLVIEHIPDIDHMVSELGRICKPGGRVIISDFHPQMIRNGYHARFRQQSDGKKLQIDGPYRPVSHYAMAAVHAGLRIAHMSEHDMDAETVRRSKSAEKWIGLPFLLVLELVKAS